MVRLSDSLSVPGEPRSSKRMGVQAEEGLPEVIILTSSLDVVNLVRQAIEDRGYRLHHSQTHEDLLTRLKVVGKVLLVVDGNIEGVTGILNDPAVSNRSLLVLAERDQASAERFPGLSDSQILTHPADPAVLLSTIQQLSATGKLPGKIESGLFFSSLPIQPSAAQPPVDEEPAPEETPTPSPTVDEDVERPSPAVVETPPPDETLPTTGEAALEASPVLPEETAGGAAKISELIAPFPQPPVEEREPPKPSEKDIEPALAEEAPSAVQLDDFEATKPDAYKEAVEAIRQFMKGHRSRTNPPMGDVAKAVEGMINELDVSPDMAMEFIYHTPAFDEIDTHHAHHLANVASLCITVGKGLKLSPQKLFELALAAAIHDVGETQLPEGLILRRGKLDESGYSQIQQHPSYGRELLQPYARAYPWLPDVIYQEHERYDGSGYPEGLEGDDIHPYARVIGLADTYEALTHSRPFREQMIPFNVLQQLIRLGGRLFHSDLVKALIDQISVFPLGSKVRLNTGEIGKVVEINKGYPLRPSVQVLFASDGSALEQGRVLDLKAEPMIYITGPAEDQA